MKSRSSGYSSDSEQTKQQQQQQQDLSVLRKPILTSLNGFLEAKRAFENGTEEIRRLLSRECDIMYECKVCRNVFRSLTNFVSHKRVYCREQCNYLNNFDSHRHGFIDQDVATIIQTEQDYVKQNTNTKNITPTKTTTTTSISSSNVTKDNSITTIPSTTTSSTNNNNNNTIEKTNKDLSSIIERLINREHINRALKLSDYYDQVNNKLTQDEILKKNHILQLDKVPNSKIAVYQTVKRCDSDNIKTEVNEIHDLLLNNKTVLGPDGKVLLNPNQIKDEKTNKTKGNENDLEKLKIKIDLTTNRIKRNDYSENSSNKTTKDLEQSTICCNICHQKFQTEKTLKLHLQTKHIQSTYVYQCPSCTQTFLHPGAVIRHLSNDHKKSIRRIRLMRETINKRRIRLDEIQVKGPSRELARLQTDKERRAADKKAWLDNIEPSPTNSPFCTYCGKKFERKAVLTTHLNSCSIKNRQTPTLPTSKKSVDLIQNNNSTTSSSSSSATTNTSISNTNSASSAFVKIEPKNKLEQDNLMELPFDTVKIDKVEKSKPLKLNIELAEKKIENSLKLIREVQQNKSSLIVNKRKRRRTKNISKKLENLNENSINEEFLGFEQNDDKKFVKSNLENIPEQQKNITQSPTQPNHDIEKELKKEKEMTAVVAVSAVVTKKGKIKLSKSTAASTNPLKHLTYFCRICKKSFSAMSNLRRHISMFHYRRRKFGCKICNYRAFRKYDVSNHLNSAHSIVGDKTFEMILVADDKTIKEDVDDDIIISENGVCNKDFREDFSDTLYIADDEPKIKEVSRKGRKPKIPKVKKSASAENSLSSVVADDANLNSSKFTRSSSNLSNSSNEDVSVVPPKRPIRNRIKPVNKDFVYDLSSLLKKDMLYAERESILTARAHRRRNTVITIDDSSRESASTSMSNSVSNSPPNGEVENGKITNDKNQIKGAAQMMAKLAVANFTACFNTPPELPTERPSIPSKILAQIRQQDRMNNSVPNPNIFPPYGNNCGFKGFDDMKKIKQLRRVSDDSIIRSLTKKRKFELDYASLSDTTSSRLLRKVDINMNGGGPEKKFNFNQFQNNLISNQQNGGDRFKLIDDGCSKITEKLLVKCPTEKEFQEYLIANKLTDPVKKINITEAMAANAEFADDGSSSTSLDDNQLPNNKRISLIQRLTDNKHKKLKESLLRTALEN